jgi:cell division protein FtsB
MALEELVRRRLLRIEERSDVARVEIIHDVLTPIIRKSRETSRREAALHRERRRRLRAYWVAAAIALMSLATTGLLYWGWSSKLEAERQRSLVEAQQAANADLQQANADLRAQVQRLENALSKVQPGSPQADLTSVRSSGWGLFEWTVIAALVTCGGAVGAAAAILSVRVLAAPGAARAVYQRGTQFHQEKTVAGPHKTVLQQLRGGNGMDASHVATGAITALLATVLVYLSHWPLQPFDLPTASAFAGLIVALGGGLVKFYKAWTASASRPVIPSVPLSPAEETAWEARRTASVAQ